MCILTEIHYLKYNIQPTTLKFMYTVCAVHLNKNGVMKDELQSTFTFKGSIKCSF